MTGKRINKNMVLRAASRALIYNLVLEIIFWALVIFAVSRHHLVTIFPYELLLHIVIMMMLAIYGITAIVFCMGLLMELFRKGGDAEHEKGN